MEITADQVAQKLAADSRLSAYAIQISMEPNRLVLEGNCCSYYEKSLMSEIVKHVVTPDMTIENHVVVHKKN